MAQPNFDSQVRLAPFEFLEEQTRTLGDVLPRSLLARGFVFQGDRIHLIGPQGIFIPAVLRDIPLTITSVPEIEGRARPYEDELGDSGLLRYRYRGDARHREHRENVGLRIAMQNKTPLIYLHGIVPGKYMPIWPVYIVGDDPDTLAFTVDLRLALGRAPGFDGHTPPDAEVLRSYVITQAKRRLHQQIFRTRVLRAYEERCAICRLRHTELLEAAHILPDGHPRGEPVVPNGIALCVLHHGAFDSNILGIRPDRRIELRLDVLEEADGPMLEHGLQEFQDRLIAVPHSDHLKPRREFLEERYQLFRKAG